MSFYGYVFNTNYYLLIRITRPGLPKKSQTFLFFRILKPDQFKERLKTFVHKITTAEKVVTWTTAQKLHKDKDAFTGINIAFTSTGLEAVSCNKNY